MLDRSKLIRALQERTDELFVDYGEEYAIARKIWDSIVTDGALSQKVRASASSLLVPHWQGNIDAQTTVPLSDDAYRCASVDGSQIYPDRHQGIGCFLINIGSVSITYGTVEKKVTLQSVPHIFTGDEDEILANVNPDIVNCKRDDYELQAGLELAKSCAHDGIPFLLLYDGTLIFWHLESKDPAVKNYFMARYIDSLNALYEQKILHASYVSSPKSKELSNIVRLALCNFDTTTCPALTSIEHLNDSGVIHFYVEPFHFSTPFKYTGKTADAYPDHIKPYFVYAHVGNEIARIEIPAWIALDEEKLLCVMRIIFDQVKKGNGYPVVLAEAHEQAVIKGPDREFFYQLLAKYGIDKKQRLILSQKSLKKRGIGI